MITRISHVCISATDLEAVRRLYCDTLGFRLHYEFLKNDKVVGLYLHAGGETYLEAFLTDHVPPGGQPIRHFCMETDDLDAVIQRLTTAGYVCSEKKVGSNGSWQTWVRNAPDGVAIEVQQHTPQSSQVTRRSCVITW